VCELHSLVVFNFNAEIRPARTQLCVHEEWLVNGSST